MILDNLVFHNLKFSNRIELLNYCIQNEVQRFPTYAFLHSKFYFCKRALEDKFNREFTFLEVMEIIDNKSWQWRKPLQIESEKAKT